MGAGGECDLAWEGIERPGTIRVTSLVSEGESGLFAHTQGEWEDGLSRLVADRPGAMALGERGRRVVSERFEASLIGSRLADLLLSAAA